MSSYFSMCWYFLIYIPIICFEWVLIDRIVKCKVHSVLWQFLWGVNLKIYLGKSENEL